MSDFDHRPIDEQVHRVNCSVMELSSSFSLASDMLALAGSFSREQVSASNLAHLNSITAMLALVREYGQRGSRADPVVNEALDLVKKVVATTQAS
jgi:hypothetical protein